MLKSYNEHLTLPTLKTYIYTMMTDPLIIANLVIFYETVHDALCQGNFRPLYSLF